MYSGEFPGAALIFPLLLPLSHRTSAALLPSASLPAPSLCARWGKKKSLRPRGAMLQQTGLLHSQRRAAPFLLCSGQALGLSRGGSGQQEQGGVGSALGGSPHGCMQAVDCYQMSANPKIGFQKCSNFVGGIQTIQEIPGQSLTLRSPGVAVSRGWRMGPWHH